MKHPARWVRRQAKANPLVRDLHYRLLSRRKTWLPLIDLIASCPDNALIPRVAGAGVSDGQTITMHNGIRVVRSGYYGPGVDELLRVNRGVHEPQEELAFGRVLEELPAQALMLELGAYWGFYSLWFHSVVAEPTCVLVEPEADNVSVGRANFALNHAEGRFIQAFVGASEYRRGDGRRVLCVDDLVGELSLDRIDVLHADIQGAELDMLVGAERSLRDGLVDFVFISTHSQQRHGDCLRFLRDRRFSILAEADIAHSYSVDGLIVARDGRRPPMPTIEISKRAAGA